MDSVVPMNGKNIFVVAPQATTREYNENVIVIVLSVEFWRKNVSV
jgi:hypothetical protein